MRQNIVELPAILPRGSMHKRRLYAESLIEQATGVLNAIDRNADLEDGRDRVPSLASLAGGDSQLSWSAGSDDREQNRQAA
jgi:hypothetical protein